MTKKQKDEPLLDKYKHETKVVLLSEIFVDKVKSKEGRQKSHSTFGTVNDVILNQCAMLEEGKKYRVIEGRKRVNDLIAEKKETVVAKVYKNLPVEIDRYALLVSNFHRSPSPIVEAEAIEELIKLGKTIKEISEVTGISEAKLSQRRSLLKKLPKEISDLLKQGKIPESTAKKIASLPKQLQSKIVKEEKITGDIVEKYHREYLDKQLSFKDLDLPQKVKGEAKVRMYCVEYGKTKTEVNQKELFSNLEDILPSLSQKDKIIVTRV